MARYLIVGAWLIQGYKDDHAWLSTLIVEKTTQKKAHQLRFLFLPFSFNTTNLVKKYISNLSLRHLHTCYSCMPYLTRWTRLFCTHTGGFFFASQHFNLSFTYILRSREECNMLLCSLAFFIFNCWSSIDSVIPPCKAVDQ